MDTKKSIGLRENANASYSVVQSTVRTTFTGIVQLLVIEAPTMNYSHRAKSPNKYGAPDHQCKCTFLSEDGVVRGPVCSLAVCGEGEYSDTHTQSYTAYSLCASSSSSSPVTAAEEGARRPLWPAELARAGRVRALCDELVQIADSHRLLRLSLREEQREDECFPDTHTHTGLSTDMQPGESKRRTMMVS